ncbi:pyroglutamyl-peptidase I [Floricoccus tropicus]|uniref:Pyroglutamyl-peptidase I n=1 Tax=Floricoccus tropicus TaxID=1859473 RepID=A0A1E8GLL4_9LACT|nr:pyroglutamyl-peptidase I [Floricoccus tropicus]OFI48398.1 pyroglutamyl-peptidase I [Floricoccus tropicus]
MKLLITGFEPFGGESINPSWELVKKLDYKIGNFTLEKLELPTSFEGSSSILFKKVMEVNPDYIINIGQAGGRSKVSIERVAINIDDAPIPDNSNYQPIDQTIKTDGENAYFSTLPIKLIYSELKKENLPIEISNTAGTFVCNHIMYEALYIKDKIHPNIKTGFVHIPYLPEQVENKKEIASMDMTKMLKVVTEMILIISRNIGKNDKKVIGGSID